MKNITLKRETLDLIIMLLTCLISGLILYFEQSNFVVKMAFGFFFAISGVVALIIIASKLFSKYFVLEIKE